LSPFVSLLDPTTHEVAEAIDSRLYEDAGADALAEALCGAGELLYRLALALYTGSPSPMGTPMGAQVASDRAEKEKKRTGGGDGIARSESEDIMREEIMPWRNDYDLLALAVARRLETRAGNGKSGGSAGRGGGKGPKKRERKRLLKVAREYASKGAMETCTCKYQHLCTSSTSAVRMCMHVCSPMYVVLCM
jgi:hypothetical protein